MKKFANFLVKYRLILFIASLVLAILCAFLVPKVVINKDQSKYLAKDSNMAQGYEIINKEFPAVEMGDSFQIVFEDLTPSEQQAIHAELADFDGVESVDYDIDSVEYNSKTMSMYLVHTKYAADNEKVSNIIREIRDEYEDSY